MILEVRSINLFLLLFFLFILLPLKDAHAELELGVNYSYKKSTFDSDNTTEQQSTTGSVSIYLWKQVALEFSYTDGLFVKKEKNPNNAGSGNFLRITTVYSNIYGVDFIFIIADSKEAMVQPYVKLGAAQIKRRQVVQDDNNNPWEINYAGLAPSYGAGLKFLLTKEFAIRTSYDVLQTPVDNNTKIDEVNGRVGLSWIF